MAARAVASLDAQIAAVIGARPSARALGDLLGDLEGMGADTARAIYGSTDAKDAYQARVADRFFHAIGAR